MEALGVVEGALQKALRVLCTDLGVGVGHSPTEEGDAVAELGCDGKHNFITLQGSSVRTLCYKALDNKDTLHIIRTRCYKALHNKDNLHTIRTFCYKALDNKDTLHIIRTLCIKHYTIRTLCI